MFAHGGAAAAKVAPEVIVKLSRTIIPSSDLPQGVTDKDQQLRRRSIRHNIIQLLKISHHEMQQNVNFQYFEVALKGIDYKYINAIHEIYGIFIKALELMQLPTSYNPISGAFWDKAKAGKEFYDKQYPKLSEIYREFRFQEQFDFGPAHAIKLNCTYEIFAFVNLRLLILLCAMYKCEQFKVSQCFSENGKITKRINNGIQPLDRLSGYPKDTEANLVSKRIIYQLKDILTNFAGFMNGQYPGEVTQDVMKHIKDVYESLNNDDEQSVYGNHANNMQRYQYDDFEPVQVLTALYQNPKVLQHFPNQAVTLYYRFIADKIYTAPPPSPLHVRMDSQNSTIRSDTPENEDEFHESSRFLTTNTDKIIQIFYWIQTILHRHMPLAHQKNLYYTNIKNIMDNIYQILLLTQTEAEENAFQDESDYIKLFDQTKQDLIKLKCGPYFRFDPNAASLLGVDSVIFAFINFHILFILVFILQDKEHHINYSFTDASFLGQYINRHASRKGDPQRYLYLLARSMYNGFSQYQDVIFNKDNLPAKAYQKKLRSIQQSLIKQSKTTQEISDALQNLTDELYGLPKTPDEILTALESDPSRLTGFPEKICQDYNTIARALKLHLLPKIKQPAAAAAAEPASPRPSTPALAASTPVHHNLALPPLDIFG